MHSIEINPMHIKSHQDIDRDYNDLTWQAKLNCNCDTAAESVRSCVECTRTAHRHYTLPPGHGATLRIGGRFITSHIQQEVKEASYRLEMMYYIAKNAKWPPGVFELVDWSARGHAAKRIRRDNHLTFCKLEFDLFATMGIRH